MPSANAIRAGKAIIELGMPTAAVEKAFRRLQAKANAIGRGFQNVGRMAIGAGATIVGAFTPAIMAASDMQETMSKFNTVFGGNAAEVKAWADSFAGDVGRSKRQIAEFMAGTQDLFVPLGFEPGAATEMSKQITMLSLDLASFNNMSDDATLRDLHAALTGSGEVMKKYGVIVSEAAVKQEMLNKGMDPSAATDQQKVLARLAIIMRGTTAAQGDALTTAGSFANRMKALRGRVEDTAGAIGAAILPSVTRFVEKISAAIGIIENFATKNATLVATVFKAGVAIAAIGGILMAAAGGFAVLGLAAGGVATAVGAIGAVLGVVISPLGAIVGLLAVLATWFVTSTDAGKAMASNLAGYFSQLWTTATETFAGIKAALSAGDLQAAADVLFAGLQLAWLQGTARLREIWVQFKDGFLGVIVGITFKARELFAKMVAEIKKIFVELRDFGADTFEVVVNYLAGIGESDRVKEELTRMQNESIMARERARRGQTRGFDAERDQELANIAAEREASNAERRASVEGQLTAQADALEKAKAKLAEAAERAEQLAEAQGEQRRQTVKEMEDQFNFGEGGAVATSSQKGTQAIFDARFAAQQFGGGNETNKLLRDIKRNTDPKNQQPGGVPVAGG